MHCSVFSQPTTAQLLARAPARAFTRAGTQISLLNTRSSAYTPRPLGASRMASTSTTTSAPTQRQTAIPLELLWVDCEVSDGSDRARELTIAQAGEKLIERSIQMSGLDLTKDVIIEWVADGCGLSERDTPCWLFI